MVSEEYSFYEISDYLINNIDLLVTGEPNDEERNHFFLDMWKKNGRDVLVLKQLDNGYVLCHLNKKHKDTLVKEDLCVGLPRYLKSLNLSGNNVLLDMSGLSHVLLMFLTKQFIKYLSPKTLFAAYIRPQKYLDESGDVGCRLCQRTGAVDSVPGFAKRNSDNQTLCTFLGFEGVRLKSVLETVSSFKRLVPIVAFPSGTPQWYNVAMRNNMNVLQSVAKNLTVYKCFSESVFGAIELLDNTIDLNDNVVLAPLGTRPHSMACAIYACRNSKARIVYDFPVETSHRTAGVASIKIYHLSTFITN